ncbi:autotransporter-associated beta strand repeat-containing protein [Variovorax rhizosphaerae]|uniref:Autotransporter-associated beta strand repeat-containing protein n=1 Tax=Variovorax rhizosphaerae TaxID=1836200 RepID=A0ABU8WTI9_9BURK
MNTTFRVIWSAAHQAWTVASELARGVCKAGTIVAVLTPVAALLAAAGPAQAQSEWTGAVSPDWFSSGNWIGGRIPSAASIANINVSSPNSAVIKTRNATARDTTVGQDLVGILSIEGGGSLTNVGSVVGNLPGSTGSVTVSGNGSTWRNTGSILVGGQATARGSLTVQNEGTLSSSGGSIGQDAGSNGSVRITGSKSTWTNALGLSVGSFGQGTLTIENGAAVQNTGFAADIGSFASGVGTVSVTGTGSSWGNNNGLNAGGSGRGTLTVSDGGIVNGPITIASKAGSIGTLNIGSAAGSPATAPGTLSATSVAFGAGTGTLVFNHNAGSHVFAPAITGKGSVQVLSGTTALTGANTWSGATTIQGGTLQVGAGGASGTLGTDPVTNNAALVFNRSNALTVSNPISGTGSLTQAGSGALTLPGANTYSGGTTLASGTLRVGNDSSLGTGGVLLGSATVLGFEGDRTLANAVTLKGLPSIDVSTGQRVVLAGTIGNGPAAGMLVKTGPGTLVLTNASTQSDGATISAGSLQIGNGAASGSLAGNVVDNGTLVFNRPDAITYRGVVSGTGALTQAGTGTLTVTGASSYTGTTTISSGTLQVGDGGASGTVSGNIVDNGALVYGRSDTRTYGGVISGTGTVTQAGNGILSLTGLNTYTGLTSVTGGVLAVNGTVAGSAQVNTGATLRGTGTVTGPVTVADGGHLAPGNSPGTLNVGSLVLNGASQIDYELGLPGQVGGTQNDLTNVAGSLTLDGTLNLANLGGMSPGTYRVFNYSGTLTDNGLAVAGQLPRGFASSDFLVDTATAGQVNLIVQSGGFALQYWDGLNTTANNAVDGGTATWNTTTTNWTNAAGAVNAPWQNGFAVFQGTAGTVTLGQNIALEGMQFRTTGYTIEGAGFALAGAPETIVRVDPSVTATINAPIADGASGPARLISSDAGLLVLGGINTYSGGTAINGGSVQIGADSNLGAASGGLSLNKGTLITSATLGSARSVDLGSDGGTFSPMSGTTLSLTGPISGSGMLTQGGSGTLVLAGANSYAGGTLLGNGVLAVASDTNLGAPGGPLEFSGGTLRADADLGIAATRPITFNAPGGRIDTNGHSATFAQTIGGNGGLTKLGGGTLVLAGNNAYEGGTTISAGTLQIGNGGTTGSVGAGDVTNNGVLAFNRSDTSVVTNAISGTGSLQQIGAGTTALTSANTYSGGTTISSGTLQLGNGGATGSITGNVAVDNGTLAFNRSDSYTFGGIISGSGGVSQAGTGTTVLSAANTYSGATTVATGTLRAASANAFSANSAHIVASGATLDTGGFNQRVAALDNGGTVSLVSAAAGSTLTVTGAYVAHSLLRLGTQLGGDGSVSDRLVLDGPGASASGNTTIQVTNLGGLGALTTGNGIEVVSGLNGATTTAQTTKSAFALANGHVDAGAYEYRLYAADAQGAGENWYLRSTAPVEPPVVPPDEQPPGQPPVAPIQVPTFRAEVPLVAALPAQLRQADLAMLGNLHRRIGDEAPSTRSQDPQPAAPGGTRRAWGRVVYADLDIQQPGVAQVHSEGHVAGLQAGTDLWASGNWRAGVYVGYLDGSADVSGNARGIVARVGYNQLQSRYLGAYATWMDAGGMYVDSVLQGGSQRFTIRPDINLGVGGKASSLAASVEVGKPFALDARWSLEPQAQIAFQRSSVDDMVLSGAQVRQDVASGWIGRLGVRLKGSLATAAGRLEPYARVNLYWASFGDSVATFIGPAGALAISTEGGYSAAEAAAGATLTLNPATSLYGEIGHLWSIGGDATLKSAVQASLGIKVRW